MPVFARQAERERVAARDGGTATALDLALLVRQRAAPLGLPQDRDRTLVPRVEVDSPASRPATSLRARRTDRVRQRPAHARHRGDGQPSDLVLGGGRARAQRRDLACNRANPSRRSATRGLAR